MTGARPRPRLTWVFALAACGRLGFEHGSGPDDAGATGVVTLVVTSDAYLSEPAGLPISDAIVLIDRGGDVEQTTTDEAGTVQFPIAGVVAYHVAYQSSQGWRVYTAAAPRPGTIELGGRSAFSLSRTMTLSVPPGTGLDSFTAELPGQCARLLPSSTPTFAFDYNPACEGRAVRLVAFRLRSGSGEYIDAGMVTLASGSTHVVTGNYEPVPTRAVEIASLPAATAAVFVDIVARSGTDLTRLTPNTGVADTLGVSAATVTTTAAPGGNALRVQASYELPLVYSSSSERVEPVTIGATTRFDAAGMLPLVTSATIDGRTLSWEGGGTGGTIIAIEASGGMVQWNAYAEPSATSVTFPQLPAALGVPGPDKFAVVTVNKLDIPDLTADVARTFDRTWQLWPNAPALLPPEGSSMSRLVYLVGL